MKQTDLLTTGAESAANRSGPDRTGCGLEQNRPVVCRTAADLDGTGLDRTGPDRTGLDWTGPDRTGLDHTGPGWVDRTSLRLGVEWTSFKQNNTQSGPERTRPDQTGLDRTGPDQGGPAATWNETARFYTERKLIWNAPDRIEPDRLQLGTEQTSVMQNGT